MKTKKRGTLKNKKTATKKIPIIENFEKIRKQSNFSKFSNKIIRKKRNPSNQITYTKKQDAGKVSTGIQNFDSLIDGGFEKNSTNLVVGGAGSGKSIFATQFIIGGMKKGEKCLYITFEEKKEQFYQHMLKFGWDLAEYEKKGLFTFLEYTPIKVKTMLEEGGGSIESIILRKKVSRVVIDSITSFALLFNNELEKKEAALSLFNMISNWGCTSFLTLEEELINKDEFGAKSMEFEVDSIVLLYYNMAQGKRERYLEILKMRGTKHSNRIHKFEIGKNGIAIKGQITS